MRIPVARSMTRRDAGCVRRLKSVIDPTLRSACVRARVSTPKPAVNARFRRLTPDSAVTDSLTCSVAEDATTALLIRIRRNESPLAQPSMAPESSSSSSRTVSAGLMVVRTVLPPARWAPWRA